MSTRLLTVRRGLALGAAGVALAGVALVAGGPAKRAGAAPFLPGSRGLAVSETKFGPLVLFGLDSAGNVFQRSSLGFPGQANHGFGPWTQLAGQRMTSIAAQQMTPLNVGDFSDQTGAIVLVGTTSSGQIRYRSQTNPVTSPASWTPWATTDGTLTQVTASLTGEVIDPNSLLPVRGKLLVAGVNKNHQVWFRTSTNAGAAPTGFTKWTLLDGAMTNVSASWSFRTRLVTLTGISTSGAAFVRTQTGVDATTWTPWTQIGTGPATQVAIVDHNCAGTLNGTQHVFALDRNGVVFESRQTAPGGTVWTPWGNLNTDARMTQIAAETEWVQDGACGGAPTYVLGVNSAGTVFASIQPAVDQPFGPWTDIDNLG